MERRKVGEGRVHLEQEHCQEMSPNPVPCSSSDHPGNAAHLSICCLSLLNGSSVREDSDYCLLFTAKSTAPRAAHGTEQALYTYLLNE